MTLRLYNYVQTVNKAIKLTITVFSQPLKLTSSFGISMNSSIFNTAWIKTKNYGTRDVKKSKLQW